MTPNEAAGLIDVAGGDRKFAELLGIDQQPGALQRVNNWKRRGMPPKVVLDNLQLIEELRKKSAAVADGQRVAS